jgi:hypothetical protein
MSDRLSLATTLTQHQAIRLDSLSAYVTALPLDNLSSAEVLACLLYDLEVLRTTLQAWAMERDL